MVSGGIILTILGLCLGSSGVSGLVVACLQRHWAKRDKQEQQRDQKDDKLCAIVAAIKVLTLDRVKHLAKCHIKDGYIDLGDKETLQDMHRAYKALGGNGHLDTAMAAVEKLPIHNAD